MTKEEAKNKIEDLSQELRTHNYNYYVLSNPTISDYDFDMELEELQKLEQQFSNTMITLTQYIQS